MKIIHLILMHFFFFSEFQLIQSNFRSIEILLKNFSKPLPGSIDRTCFLINWTSWIKFFFFFLILNSVWLIQNTFSIFFFKLSSLSPTWQSSTEDSLSFSTKFLQGFSLTKPVRPLYPSFCFYFHDFMHKLMHFKGFSELFKIGIFVESILFF